MIATDPLVRVHLDHGAMLESPRGWPQLPAPEPGELMTAYIARAIFGNPFLGSVEQLCRESGFSFRRLLMLRPASCTTKAWQAKHSRRMFTITSASESSKLFELRELVYGRLVAALFDQLRSGELRAKGQRVDVVGGDPNVPAELWGNPDMLWLHIGEFRPQQRQGCAPPGTGLWSFVELTLWPAAPATKPPEPRQKPAALKQLLADAVLALWNEGVDINSRAVSVKQLHTMARTKAGITRDSSESTFERALQDARARIAKA
jgi:hypothetical protein